MCQLCRDNVPIVYEVTRKHVPTQGMRLECQQPDAHQQMMPIKDLTRLILREGLVRLESETKAGGE